jgi:hypothetical protein
MKKNKFINKTMGQKLSVFLLAVSAMFVVTSCEEDLVIFDTPNGFLQVNSPTGSKAENDETPIVTTVLLGKSSNESDLTVNFQVNSADASRYTFSPSSGQVVIPAGEFTAEISLTPVNNFETDGYIDVEIVLLESQGIPVGIGGEGINSAKRVITITDDDCPIEINDWVGTYSVFENFTGGGNAPLGLNNFFGESYQMAAALVPGDVTNSKVVWTNSSGFNVYFDAGTVMSFISCAGTVSFDAGFPRVAEFRVFEFTGATYNENDYVIQCTGPLATFGPYQFTLTKL